MSILIKGMEMPKSCDKCIYAGWSNFFQIYVCEAIKKEEPVLFNGKQVKSTDIARSGRADNCPLIEVPEPHGRLGDLDRLEQMFVDIDNAPYSGFDGTEPFYSAEDAAQIIRLAPTVIPASEVAPNINAAHKTMEETPEIQHVGYDDAQLGREK